MALAELISHLLKPEKNNLRSRRGWRRKLAGVIENPDKRRRLEDEK